MTIKTESLCQYWECNRKVTGRNFLCSEHHKDRQQNKISECPDCGKFKEAKYDKCYPCSQKTQPVQESSEQWKLGDEEATEFFVYIMKLQDGKFDIGQTRDLRLRFCEHRDNKVDRTAGKNPKLVYFETHESRELVTKREAELKQLNKANPRKIYRMVMDFADLYRLVTID